MRVVFTPRGWADYEYWQTADRRLTRRINVLIDDITRDDPFEGIGKPERLRANLSGLWSRHINDEHRLVYFVEGDDAIIVAARYHYERS